MKAIFEVLLGVIFSWILNIGDMVDGKVLVKPISPLQYYYMRHYYNPFWYGGPLDGGDAFEGPFGGFAPNPFGRPGLDTQSSNRNRKS